MAEQKQEVGVGALQQSQCQADFISLTLVARLFKANSKMS